MGIAASIAASREAKYGKRLVNSLGFIGEPVRPPVWENFAADIEAEVSSYFQDMYSGRLNVDDVVDVLKRFSPQQRCSLQEPAPKVSDRNQKVFACMTRSLIEDFEFFPRYIESDVKITAALFGSLIKHALLSNVPRVFAEYLVLDALLHPVDSKMFSLGVATLEQFMDRLGEWRSFTLDVLEVFVIRLDRGDIVDFITIAALWKIFRSAFVTTFKIDGPYLIL